VLPRIRARLWELFSLRQHVGDMHGALVQHRSAADCAADYWDGELADRANWDRAVVGDEAEPVAFHAVDRGSPKENRLGPRPE